MNLNFEHIAAHISDFIKNENFFDIFEIEDIKTIMKNSHLTADQYITLLKQSSSTLNANKLYICTRKANVTIQNFDEVVSILKSVTKYMKFNIFDGIIDFINQKDKELRDSTEEIKNLQTELKTLQNQIQNAAKETTVTPINKTHNFSREFLTKLSSLKETKDFDSVYQFFEELSSKGNREMISKACEEGLWKKTIWSKENVLHVASEKGNLNLVKSLIECGCDKEANDKDGRTPLFFASSRSHLEVVKYLISVGADKEANDKDGWTPLIWASYYGRLDVVKYLISVGANKEAKDNDGRTPLILASENGKLEVVQYLISNGADKEAKDKYGRTPLIWASFNGHLEVVKYLISVGADKEAKDNGEFTPLIKASSNDHLEVVQYLISVGADKDAKNIGGNTALSYARDKVREYLKSIGAK
ncbi:ankyrin repeat protein, putative [Trichomonas vaginalis G3]|uniref:Ankyrin repeat protein, putative n=1 Tax=Trichomonas vaginalis (strain ATCC PRA-98 / G3) TaxID=412133 RepID=A2E7A5_TRIV3|nr:ankyrin repeat protein family [Trichomonas vaginalis G3]EAY11502.1 ankyrin repeat protein, putative [Trichomonas vaginalis G3]KAI5526735.1 ankyrin repeat protein family [Trichomonas vaginalis G3]|eukprot:XP_001323725.1 ankyrin repeat protein [Trichomonas vaginalis G3]